MEQIEFNNTTTEYEHRKNNLYCYDFRRKFPKNCEYRKSEESFPLDDYTTSSVSYEETIRRPDLVSPQSKSEYKQSHGYNKREKNKHHSPIKEYEYLKRGDSAKKRSKLTESAVQDVFYQFEIDSDKYKKRERKSQSPWKRYEDYNDYIYNMPEEYDYKQYFEKTISREKGPKIIKIEENFKKARKKYNQYDSENKEKEYQVFSYKEPKLLGQVFQYNDKVHAKGLGTETEIKHVDYPMLVFKDNTFPDKESDMVYLPVMVVDKKTKSHENSVNTITSSQPGNIQVFAENLKNHNGVFNSLNSNIKNSKKITKQAVSNLKTGRSLVPKSTELKEVSNGKTSTKRQIEDFSAFENSHPINQGLKQAEPVLHSTFETAGHSSKSPKIHSSNKIKRHIKMGQI